MFRLELTKLLGDQVETKAHCGQLTAVNSRLEITGPCADTVVSEGWVEQS